MKASLVTLPGVAEALAAYVITCEIRANRNRREYSQTERFNRRVDYYAAINNRIAIADARKGSKS